MTETFYTAYNENGELADFAITENKTICSHCKKQYISELTEQIPGFRDKDYDYCPYCGKCNGSSMEWEFNNYKID